MPKPGPRPYECVRRAWHSDRHQPIRGSIIQSIFRVVNGRHSTNTKSNREWQEKLPIVVFKAEEIMYSKANSEVEYMNLDTLWDRVNEAINIIIRRDETAETGGLLPPCVEAALNLGCVPVRASRSQRHSNPRNYLSPRNPESDSAAPKTLSNITNERNPTSEPRNYANQSIDGRPRSLNLTYSLSESNMHATQNNISDPTASHKIFSPPEKFPSPRDNQFVSLEGNTSVNMGRVYPLYSGSRFQPEVSRLGRQTQMNSNTIIFGTPVYPLVNESTETGCLKMLFSCDREDNAFKKITCTDSRDNHENASERAGCDLSLRLGLCPEPSSSRGKGSVCDIGGVDVNISQEGSQLSLIPAQNKEIPLFPVEIANGPPGFSTSNQSCEHEGQRAEAADRKRKLPSNSNVGDGQIFWQPDLTSNWFSGRTRWPGL